MYPESEKIAYRASYCNGFSQRFSRKSFSTGTTVPDNNSSDCGESPVKIQVMKAISARIRTMLARELKLEEQALTDDYPWLDEMGSEDAEYFLAEVDDAFTTLPSGFSVGSGKGPFKCINAEALVRIGTVGGLIEYVERHVAGRES